MDDTQQQHLQGATEIDISVLGGLNIQSSASAGRSTAPNAEEQNGATTAGRLTATAVTELEDIIQELKNKLTKLINNEIPEPERPLEGAMEFPNDEATRPNHAIEQKLNKITAMITDLSRQLERVEDLYRMQYRSNPRTNYTRSVSSGRMEPSSITSRDNQLAWGSALGLVAQSSDPRMRPQSIGRPGDFGLNRGSEGSGRISGSVSINGSIITHPTDEHSESFELVSCEPDNQSPRNGDTDLKLMNESSLPSRHVVREPRHDAREPSQSTRYLEEKLREKRKEIELLARKLEAEKRWRERQEMFVRRLKDDQRSSVKMNEDLNKRLLANDKQIEELNSKIRLQAEQMAEHPIWKAQMEQYHEDFQRERRDATRLIEENAEMNRNYRIMERERDMANQRALKADEELIRVRNEASQLRAQISSEPHYVPVERPQNTSKKPSFPWHQGNGQPTTQPDPRDNRATPQSGPRVPAPLEYYAPVNQASDDLPANLHSAYGRQQDSRMSSVRNDRRTGDRDVREGNARGERELLRSQNTENDQRPASNNRSRLEMDAWTAFEHPESNPSHR